VVVWGVPSNPALQTRVHMFCWSVYRLNLLMCRSNDQYFTIGGRKWQQRGPREPTQSHFSRNLGGLLRNWGGGTGKFFSSSDASILRSVRFSIQRKQFTSHFSFQKFALNDLKTEISYTHFVQSIMGHARRHCGRQQLALDETKRTKDLLAPARQELLFRWAVCTGTL